MPGPRHDATNDLVREHPELVRHLLRTVGGADLPDTPILRVHSGELNDRISTDRHADTLILGGPPHDPWYALICETETRLSAEKFTQALRYAATVWLLLNKPVHVLFITPDPNADRYAHPVTLDAGGLTVTLIPCVCGPGQIPPITDPGQVMADPALATLSVMNHGHRKEITEAFLTGLNALDPDDAPRYYEYAYNMAVPEARHVLEALMATTTWPVYSPFAKEHYGKGVAEGRAEGREEGQAEGRVQGQAQGKAAAVLAVLTARGLQVSDEQRRLIEATTDHDRLDHWLRHVATVESAEQLLTNESA
ncbi:hypothetical protein [Microbispora sp. NPDC049125]|uniref:hypothetical protein n=1 Tax=Microbispora sp. NPDC049125 TaxID=3154929 RepID=UPI003465D028